MITWELDEVNSGPIWRLWTGRDEHGILWTIDRYHDELSTCHELHLYRADPHIESNPQGRYQERVLVVRELTPAEADRLEMLWKQDLDLALMAEVL